MKRTARPATDPRPTARCQMYRVSGSGGPLRVSLTMPGKESKIPL